MNELVKELEQAAKLLDFVDFDNYHMGRCLQSGDIVGAQLTLKTQEERIGEAIQKLAAVLEALRNLPGAKEAEQIIDEHNELKGA